MADSELEDRFRRMVRRRLPRGPLRQRVAEAAGHTHSSWVTNWLSGVQKHASLDEIVVMARELKIPLAGVVHADEIDVELLQAVADGRTAEQIRAFLRLPSEVREVLAQMPSPLEATGRTPARSAAPKPARIQETGTKSAAGRRR